MKIFKSYGFWTALAGALVVLINAIGKCCGFSVKEELVTDIIMAIAGVLVVFGVVTMPKKDGENTEKQENESVAQEENIAEEGEALCDNAENQADNSTEKESAYEDKNNK